MVSTKLAISALFAVLVIAQAAPKNNSYGGSAPANISGQQTGFRSGFVRQGGKSGRHGGQSNNEWGMEMGQRSCQAPTCYTPQTTNDTINKINALWATYVAGTTNCSSIQEREYAIVKDASDQYVAARAANLTAPALSIFKQFESAYKAFDSAASDVQMELVDFEFRLLLEGGPGPSEFCPTNRMNRPFGK